MVQFSFSNDSIEHSFRVPGVLQEDSSALELRKRLLSSVALIVISMLFR